MSEGRRRRGDAVANERRVLDAAAVAIRREGLKVPIATIAADAGVAAPRAEIRALLERVLRRGKRDGSIRAGVAGGDIIIFGAMLAQPLPHVPDWDRVARRQAQVFLAGPAAGEARVARA